MMPGSQKVTGKIFCWQFFDKDHGMVVVGVDTRRGGGGDPEARGACGTTSLQTFH